MTASSSTELMTLAEAARRFKLSKTYLRDIARNGRLKAQKFGRDWLTTEEDVREYLRSRQQIRVDTDEADP